MYTQFEIKKLVLPVFLIIALLLPTAAYAAAPNVPEFSGAAVIELNGNIPAFTSEDSGAKDYTEYSELDALGRTGQASACISRNAFPTELRAESGEVLPAGWQTVRYDDVIDGRYLYSLCYLIAPELSGSGSEPRNTFTGTRYLRLESMRPFEDMIEDFLRRTAYHVLYRVTPFYRGNELVPFGVQMEAYSVEDAGKSVSFNVFAYNIQPGVSIDYQSGDSKLSKTVTVAAAAKELIEARWLPPLSSPTLTAAGSSGTQTYAAGSGTSSDGILSASANASQGGYFADQGNVDKDDIGTRAVSGFLDAAGYSGDDLLGRLRYDDSAYEQAVYGSGDAGFY